MKTDRDFERIAKAWLAGGPTDLPDRVLDAVIDEIHLTRQRRRERAPWRLPTMTTPARLAGAAVIGVLLIGGVLILARPDAHVAGPSPAPSASAAASAAASTGTASASPIAIPALDATFTSERYGFSVRYPTGWTYVQATVPWAPGAATLWGDPALDVIRGSDIRLVAASQPLVQGQTADDWYRAYCTSGAVTGCATAPTGWTHVTIDRQSGYVDLDGLVASGGTMVPGGRIYDAIVVSHGRAYAFTMDGNLDRGVFNAILATIQLRPPTSHELPKLTGSFTSPTYGYTVGTADGWTIKPATSKWTGYDNSPPATDEIAFAGTDSGLAGASQSLPQGVTFAQFLVKMHENTLTGVPAGCDGGDPSNWPWIQIGDQPGSLDLLCIAAEAVVSVGGRVYVFDWTNSTFDSGQHLSIQSWQSLLRSITFDPTSAR
jgi:hypothetical protein